MQGVLPNLNFPPLNVSTHMINGAEVIFDPCRRRRVKLTPEEWVRQHLLSYLVEYKEVPIYLIGVEKQLILNKLRKRFDIVVFDRTGTAVVLAECKAPAVNITQAVFDQAARYNMKLGARYFIITNGLQHYICYLDPVQQTYRFMEDIPIFSEL